MILVGTSGYNYPEWKGSFYPADLAAAKMLPYYAARFPTVEINYTFRQLPKAATLESAISSHRTGSSTLTSVKPAPTTTPLSPYSRR